MISFSISSLLLYAFLAYIGYSTYMIYGFINPRECLSKDEKLCLNPSFKRNDIFQLFLCTSLDQHPLAKKLDCFHHNSSFKLSETFNLEYQIQLPEQTINNGSLFLHAILTKLMSAREPTENVLVSKHTTSTVAFLTKYDYKKDNIFNLLSDQTGKSKVKRVNSGRPVTHWKSRFILSGLGEPFSLYNSDLPYEILHLFQLDSKKRYFPIIYLSDVRQRLEDVREIPEKQHSKQRISMPLEIIYEPITIGKLRLIVIVERAFRMMKQFGFTERDVEDVKGIFFDTNHFMLLVTILIISFHTLFDFLAFKNDIQFWRNRQTMEGVSFGSILFRCISQFIITLYLFDRNTSLLVLIPSGIATLIEIWKLLKLLGIQWVGWFRFVRQTPSERTELEKKTSAYDSRTMKMISYYLLPPLLIGGSVYSILYSEHRSWYSWAIETAVNGVYAFGFIAMLPQLIINYQLKSVAHLPWRAFMYKAFNTFIDDFFAFLMTSVPTSHRLATFRDDIVFLIYLYQRWLYPIDKSRSTYGDEVDKSHKDGQVKKEKESKKTK